MKENIYFILKKIYTTELPSTNPERGFSADSNPARGDSEVCDGEKLRQ